ncbi:hypothetical protein [Massilia endophytica]|uniref:hypothetical protein n=1 Tax=Massilia endophytica TaxID=2899220 RepID=UPI001E525776|nr:hypothetical protein [Massilia endophytica]UGQ45518.1 hypothetical protein LSQ66_17235 [Massilia endophytica]
MLRFALRAGIVIGILDILSAMVFWYALRGMPPERILQSVAAGLLGPSAFSWGQPAALLGGVLHLLMAVVIAAIFGRWAARSPYFELYPYRMGALFGLAVYIVMNMVVVPLSNAVHPKFNLWWVSYNVVFSHMICVGLCLAWMARDSFQTAASPAA